MSPEITSQPVYTTLQLAQQLRHMQHPAGDLADFLGNLQQQQQLRVGYGFMSSPNAMNHAALTSLALNHRTATLLGFSVQDQAAAAASVLFARERQTAALLNRNPYSVHPTAFSVMNPHQNSLHPYGAMYLGTPGGATAETPPRQAGGAETRAPAPKDAATGKRKRSSSESRPSKPPVDSLIAKPAAKPAPAKTEVSSSTVDKPEATGAEIESPVAEEPDKKVAKKEESKASASPVVETIPLFFTPPLPPSTLSTEEVATIKNGRFFDFSASCRDINKRRAGLTFLLAVGDAVPIPNPLVLIPVNERLDASGLRGVDSIGDLPISRQTVAATILCWLWACHAQDFQRLFSQNNRTAFDPSCAWLIQAGVETAVRELTFRIADSMTRQEGPFASFFKSANSDSSERAPLEPSASLEADISTASIVSRALLAELQLDDSIDQVLPLFSELTEYLDEVRKCALRAKAKERTLLASLMATKTAIGESFAMAYVSATVRAGEALGHGHVFATVQDESIGVSSMIPYDFFTIEGNLWEDAGRSEQGFNSKVTGDDLLRRAHARAIMQKCLRKIQDKHSIGGGVPDQGPYAETPSSGLLETSAEAAPPVKKQPLIVTTPKGIIRRRSSFGQEAPVPTGTGSAPATAASLYNPHHASAPLVWDTSDAKNLPYGRHVRGDDSRSSASRGNSALNSKTTNSALKPPDPGSRNSFPASTREIEWADVTGIFQSVELPKRAGGQRSTNQQHQANGDAIVAPYCRKVSMEQIVDDASDVEDCTDEAVISRHQEVLDDMKTKMAAYLEAKKLQQERRKIRARKS
jgi:hypothetical protein